MPQVKFFEVRDRMTCIPVVAIWLTGNSDAEVNLAARAGYGRTAHEQDDYVLVAPLSGGQLHFDPFAWSGPTRTMPTAHRYIQQHFPEMASGAVVDVRWILGEIPAPAASDNTPAGA